MKFSRQFALPSHETFSIKPIRELIDRYVEDGMIVVDPFARDSLIGTLRNDLNPDTKAQWNMRAEEFLSLLKKDGVKADVGLIDPPYSPRQVKEHYDGFGLPVTQQDTQTGRLYRLAKEGVDAILKPEGIVICFGWNSIGMPKKLGYERVETLLVYHGGAHNDTIVTVDRKLPSSAQSKVELATKDSEHLVDWRLPYIGQCQ